MNSNHVLLIFYLFAANIVLNKSDDKLHDKSPEANIGKSFQDEKIGEAESVKTGNVNSQIESEDLSSDGKLETTNLYSGADAPSVPKLKEKLSPEDRYKRLFNSNRVLQVDAVRSIRNLDGYDAKYRLIKTTLEHLFRVLTDAKVNLTEKAYMPGDPFPEDETTREALSKMYENTAMFGDLVLRMPEIVHRIYDGSRKWHLVLSWSLWFCNESNIFTGPNAELLNLMAQEVDLKPKEPEYVNPFKEIDEKEDDSTIKSSKKKQKRNKKVKGKLKKPRISKQHNEL